MGILKNLGIIGAIIIVGFLGLYFFYPQLFVTSSVNSTVNNTILNLGSHYNAVASNPQAANSLEQAFNVSPSNLKQISQTYYENSNIGPRQSFLVINYTKNGKIYELPVWFNFNYTQNATFLPNLNGKLVQANFEMNVTPVSQCGHYPKNCTYQSVTFDYILHVTRINSNDVLYNFTLPNASINQEVNFSNISGFKQQIFNFEGFKYNSTTVYIVAKGNLLT